MTVEDQEALSKKIFYILVGTGIVLNATGLFNEILEPDSALYAGIAKQIALSGNWINLYGDGSDWLDKPHFPFWMAAISFKLFGISAFAYKLPSFLFWIAGARFTYLLARSLFNTAIARVAVIMYISSLHVIISNFDVRAEGYLTCCSMAAIYYIYKAAGSKNIRYIMLAALFTACAVMTKGIFILFTIAGGQICYWIIAKEWRQFINYKWWLLLLLTFIFIVPELYCLYRQFDLHPEKVIFGKTHVSGIRFFFWDSQFGRFFNTGPIKGTGDKTFFLHTTLWAFLPWSALLFAGVIQLIRRKISMQKSHWIVYGGAIITFLLFSLSSFQLPHYILIIFPQCAILTAAFLIHSTTNKKAIKRIILYLSALIILLVCAFCALAFTGNFTGSTVCIILLLCTGIFSLLVYRKKDIQHIAIKGMAFAGMLALFLNLYFYPHILQYQSGMIAAGWLKKNKLYEPVTMYKTYSYSLEFYAPGKVQRAADEDKFRQYLNDGPVLMYAMQEDIAALTNKNYRIDTLQAFDHFPVSRLNLKFLNQHTRTASLKRLYIVHIASK